MEPQILNEAICVKNTIHRVLDWNLDTFPGSRSIPLRRHQLLSERIHDDYIFLRHKEGHDAIIYHGKEGFFWYGTNGEIRTLSPEGLCPPFSEYCFTIFEAVWVPEDKRFYINDAMFVNGADVTRKTIKERLTTLKFAWLDLKLAGTKDQISYVINNYWDVSCIRENDLLSGDGLIIRRLNEYYKKGRNTNMFKWKPTESLKILLRLIIERTESGLSYYLYGLNDEGNEQMYCHLRHLAGKDMSPLLNSGSIVECIFEPTQRTLTNSGNHWIDGVWYPIREFSKAKKPMENKKVWSTWITIQDNITFEELITFVKENNEKKYYHEYKIDYEYYSC